MGSNLGSGFGGGFGSSRRASGFRFEILSVFVRSALCTWTRRVSAFNSSRTAGAGTAIFGDSFGVLSFGTSRGGVVGTREVIERIGARSSAGAELIFGTDLDESAVLLPPSRGTRSVVVRIASPERSWTFGGGGSTTTAALMLAWPGTSEKCGARSVTSLAARQGSPSFLTRSVGRSWPPRTRSRTASSVTSSLWPGMPSIHSLRGDIVTPRLYPEHLQDGLRAGIHFLARDALDPLRSELFHRERPHDRSVDHRAPHRVGRRARLGQVSEQAARERVAGPGRVDHAVRREGRHRELAVPGGQGGAVLPALHDENLGAEVQYFPHRLRAAGGVGQLQGLLEVDADRAHPRQQADDGRPLRADPQVHRVQQAEFRLLQLVQHRRLHPRRDVAQEHIRRRGPGRRDLGLEGQEYAEVDGDRRRARHVPFEAAVPAEGLAVGALEAGEVDLLRLEHLEMLRREVAADDPDHPHRREAAGGQREMSRRSAQFIVGAPVRRLERIERHAPHHQHVRHSILRVESIREMTRSLPRMASVSCMGGLWSLPVRATRSGWATLPSLTPRFSATAFSRFSTGSFSKRSLGARPARSSSRIALPPSAFSHFATAFSSYSTAGRKTNLVSGTISSRRLSRSCCCRTASFSVSASTLPRSYFPARYGRQSSTSRSSGHLRIYWPFIHWSLSTRKRAGVEPMRSTVNSFTISSSVISSRLLPGDQPSSARKFTIASGR